MKATNEIPDYDYLLQPMTLEPFRPNNNYDQKSQLKSNEKITVNMKYREFVDVGSS